MKGKSRFLAALGMTMLVALLLSVCPSGPRAQGSKYKDRATKSVTGGLFPAAGATTAVCATSSTIVGGVCVTPEIDASCCFTDATLTVHIPQGNPFPADTLGNYFFWAAPGKYQVSVSGSGITALTKTVVVGCIPGATECAGGGGSPARPAGTLQKTNNLVNGFDTAAIVDKGPSINMTEAVTVGGNETVNGDSQIKGPDPYTDARAYGVRSVNPSVAPAVPGITATINSSSASATISAPSTFQNGDGVVIYGAGVACALSTPTGVIVTPSVAAAGTGTGFVVNAPVGGTSYGYAVIARDKQGCLTAVSSAGTTSTGTSAIGSQSVSVSGFTRSVSLVTATTSSAHGLSVGSMVYITTSSQADALYFGGWYVVATVPDTTHFTFLTGNAVAEGAPAASGGGGTVYWFNANHVSWNPVTNAVEYYIYGRTSGSLTLLGVSRPQNAGQGITDATWDDFGSPMMDGILLPYFVPSTPPSVSLPRPLVTTIVSGAGTTGLTLAHFATTSVTNATILFDNTPNIQTAAATTTNTGLLYFPPLGTYVTNSYLTIPAGVAMNLAAANLWLNDTMEIGNNDRILGMLGPQGNSTYSFAWSSVGGFITVNRANPGVWGINGNGIYTDGIQIGGSANGQLLAVMDGGGDGAQFQIVKTNFVDGGSGDFMGMNLLVRGGFWNKFDTVTFGAGPGQSGRGFIGTTATPAAYINSGSTTFKNMSVQDRGIFFNVAASGSSVIFDGTSRAQGNITPFLTAYNCCGNNGSYFQIGDVEMDTTQMPRFANLSAGSLVGSLVFSGGEGACCGYGDVEGKPMGLVVGEISGQNNSAISGYNFTNNPVSVTGNGEFMVSIANNTAPGVVVSAGGSIPLGNGSYAITMVDINGNESLVSPHVNVTITTGNQTVTVTSPAAPAGAVGFMVYRGGPNGSGLDRVNGSCFTPVTFPNTLVDTSAGSCGHGAPIINRAGAQSVSSSGLSGTAFNIVANGFKNVISGSLSANRTSGVTDANDVLPSIQNCGTTSTCAKTPQTSAIFVYGGPIALAAGTLTVTSLPFTSSTSFVCTANDVTRTNAIEVVYSSGSSATFNGTGTDSFRYTCIGN
jgi:hypothetical protein